MECTVSLLGQGSVCTHKPKKLFKEKNPVCNVSAKVSSGEEISVVRKAEASQRCRVGGPGQAGYCALAYGPSS